MAGRLLSARTFITRSHVRSLGNGYTGEFDQRTIMRESSWGSAVDQEHLVLFPWGRTQGQAVKRSSEHVLPQVCAFGMLSRTITRAQFVTPSSHGAVSGLCWTRLQQRVSGKQRSSCSLCHNLILDFRGINKGWVKTQVVSTDYKETSHRVCIIQEY